MACRGGGEDAQAFALRAYCHVLPGNRDKCEADYKKAVQLAPELFAPNGKFGDVADD